ncbi:putative nuclease HARBI1 [Heterodontus francisci]|uniref:putative nuclease HARBI1 n=1 Tax=Heterodontus francisci TaxID=7792 RepID=UPI00355B5178
MGFSRHPMPVALKVTATLNFYASASFEGPTGDLCGVSQSAVHHCIREVTDALYRTDGDYVRFRKDPEYQAQRAVGFGAIAGVPEEMLHAHVCPLSMLSMPSYHDSFILCQSQVPMLFTAPVQIQKCLLGDKGYPLQTWLLMPVSNSTSDAEERYNACHGLTRATIEQAISMLKMRFLCLDRSGGAQQHSLERVVCITAVCCALHNIALQSGEALQDDERQEQETSSDDKDTEEVQQQTRVGGRRSSMQRRQGEQRARDARQCLTAERFHYP